MSDKSVDVFKTFTATKVAEEKGGENTAITVCLTTAATLTNYIFGEFFKAKLGKNVHHVINSTKR